MIDILDRYLAELSEQRKREFLGRYLGLEDDSLFSILGSRLTFGLRDDWQLRSASLDQELAGRGRLWFKEATPGLRKAVQEAWRDESQPEDTVSLVQEVADLLKRTDEEWPAPIMILAILLVKGGFVDNG
jgi:hypothetical protein